ncbi:TetR/AcrR family transcriptional regulator [Pseudonocardia abyssalis]|nr:TetR family transcriptional regulator [Pseudonocardia abyssalis]
MASDGRRAKGERRRRLLLDATLRLVGRAGVAAVTQRAVAAEAEVAPSAVLYYFPTVDELLVAALVDVNDRWVAAVGDLPADRSDALDALAELVVASPTGDEGLAEFELYLLAARRPELRPELDRWWHALDDLAARLAPDREVAFAAALDGLFLRASTGVDLPDVRTVLEQLTS